MIDHYQTSVTASITCSKFYFFVVSNATALSTLILEIFNVHGVDGPKSKTICYLDQVRCAVLSTCVFERVNHPSKDSGASNVCICNRIAVFVALQRGILFKTIRKKPKHSVQIPSILLLFFYFYLILHISISLTMFLLPPWVFYLFDGSCKTSSDPFKSFLLWFFCLQLNFFVTTSLSN